MQHFDKREMGIRIKELRRRQRYSAMQQSDSYSELRMEKYVVRLIDWQTLHKFFVRQQTICYSEQE